MIIPIEVNVRTEMDVCEESNGPQLHAGNKPNRHLTEYLAKRGRPRLQEK